MDLFDKNVVEILLKEDLMQKMPVTDTIVPYKKPVKGFYNINTGKRSTSIYDIIRDDVGYVYPLSSDFGIGIRKGYISKYYEQYDILLSVFYILKEYKDMDDNPVFEWIEDRRVIMNKLHFQWFIDGLEINNDFISDNHMDLCGQFVQYSGHVIGYSEDEIYKFIKGTWIEPNFCNILGKKICPIIFFCRIISDVSFKNHVKEHMKPYFGNTISFDMDGISEINDFPSIPEVRINVIGRVLALSSSLMSLGYLQNVDGEYVLRIFNVLIRGNYYKQGIAGGFILKFFEMRKIHVTEKVLYNMELINVPLIGFDTEGLNSGIFKYCTEYLEQAERETWNTLNNHRIPFNGLCSIKTAVAMAFMPFFEKFVHLLKAGLSVNPSSSFISCITNELEASAKHCNTNFYEELRELFGYIDFTQNDVHKALGLPKCFFDILCSKMIPQGLQIIKLLKFVFNDSKYLSDMNKDSLEKIIEVLVSNYCVTTDNKLVLCLSKLVSLFGPYNIFNYCKFLRSSSGSQDYFLTTYDNYLDKLLVVGNEVHELEWKLKGEELERASESLNEAYITLNDKKKYAATLKKFEKQHEDWKKYEYKNEMFFITYPKGPTELIEEGVRLNHCAKTFIEKVASGETLLLFIRKNENPNKPFYTMEIRDGMIRQCHGFNNCNVCETEGVFEFIKEFAGKKEIICSGTLNKLLGAG